LSRIKLVFIGDERDVFVEAARDYLSRSGKRFDADLVAIKRAKNAAELQLRASEGCARVALDACGVEHDSVAFAKALEKLLERGKVAFVVGGAEGLDTVVRAKADAVWSLSKLTFPHRLAVLVVAEQIYRASEIARGGPYHK
jgi:23S rRNA (pseudouridine1915-N3)-methyltransferase